MTVFIGTPQGSCGMGDVLLLTAICKHMPDQVCVELFPKAEKYRLFFDHICKDVIITDNAAVTKDIGSGHFAQRKMRSLGLHNLCYLPYIYPKPEYLNTGLQLIKKYPNPIAFVANCASSQHIRQPPINILQECVNQLANKYTVLQFGISNNFTQLKNTIPIVDIDIHTLLCYYTAIKQIVGVDTGDIHAMIAVGGTADILIPKSTPHRDHDQWNYKHYSHIRYHIF
jgi:hypothetical protein